MPIIGLHSVDQRECVCQCVNFKVLKVFLVLENGVGCPVGCGWAAFPQQQDRTIGHTCTQGVPGGRIDACWNTHYISHITYLTTISMTHAHMVAVHTRIRARAREMKIYICISIRTRMRSMYGRVDG